MDASTACLLIGTLALASAPIATAEHSGDHEELPQDICYEVNPHTIPPVYVYFCHDDARATRR